MPTIRGDKVRALAVASTRRLDELPNVPTFAEAGYPEFEVNAWYALYAPARTPASIVARLNTELGKILKLPDVNDKLRGFSVRPESGSPEALASFTASEYAKYEKIIKSANIKPD
jgi:tripartite-type tricarboxylate transporter receptor subunit TctC